VNKIPISRDELKAKVLSDLRSHPGCEGVTEVEVTLVNIAGADPSWHVNVIDEGFAKREQAITAARDVQDALQSVYALID